MKAKKTISKQKEQKPKFKSWQIPDKMFCQDIRLYCGDKEAIKQELSTVYNLTDSSLNFSGVGGKFFNLVKEKPKYQVHSVICIFNTDRDKDEIIGLLTHELFHLTMRVMDNLGMRFDLYTSNECYAYYIQHIMQNILSTPGFFEAIMVDKK